MNQPRDPSTRISLVPGQLPMRTYKPASLDTCASAFNIPTPRQSIYSLDESAVAALAAVSKNNLKDSDSNLTPNSISTSASASASASATPSVSEFNPLASTTNSNLGLVSTSTPRQPGHYRLCSNNTDQNENDGSNVNANGMTPDVRTDGVVINNGSDLSSSTPIALGISLPGQPISSILPTQIAPTSLPGYDEQSANRFQAHQRSQSEVSVPLGKAWTGIASQDAADPDGIDGPVDGAATIYNSHIRDQPALPLTPPQGSPCGSKVKRNDNIPSPAQGVGAVAPAWTGGYVPIPAQTSAVSASDFYNKLYADLRATGAAPLPFSLPQSNRQWVSDPTEPYTQYNLTSDAAQAQSQQQQALQMQQIQEQSQRTGYNHLNPGEYQQFHQSHRMILPNHQGAFAYHTPGAQPVQHHAARHSPYGGHSRTRVPTAPPIMTPVVDHGNTPVQYASGYSHAHQRYKPIFILTPVNVPLYVLWQVVVGHSLWPQTFAAIAKFTRAAAGSPVVNFKQFFSYMHVPPVLRTPLH